MNKIFSNNFEILWKYRLGNMDLFSSEAHQIVLTMSIIDYYISRNRVEKEDIYFNYIDIKEKLKRCRDFFNNNDVMRDPMNICLEIMDSIALFFVFNK